MSDRTPELGKKALKSAALGLAVGYLASPVTTEKYLHLSLAHDTYTLSPKLKFLSWLACRGSGFSPTTWAVSHRLHHSPFDSQPKSNPAQALIAALKSGVGNRAVAEEAIADPQKLPHIIYASSRQDPIIDISGSKPQLRFQNSFDEWLSRHPLLEKAMPIATIATLTALRVSTTNRRPIAATVESAGFTLGYATGAFTPGIAASYPERRDGYANPSQAGRDFGSLGQFIIGGYALHASHHQAPHLAQPPNTSALNRDVWYGRALEALGLGTRHDGQPSS